MKISFRSMVMALMASLAALAVGVADQAFASTSPAGVSAPKVWPTPQQQSSRLDGFEVPATAVLFAGKSTDQSALRVVRDTLEHAGVRHIVLASERATIPDGALRVYVGGPSENPEVATALRGLGLQGPEKIKAEGYVLGIGRDRRGRALVVLAGRDPDGTFYAAQSLRQLVDAREGAFWLPGVEIRDWPTTPLRGTIEVFYGVPWSTQDRLDQFDFHAATKQNAYMYSPKDDPYLRAKWRDPYPEDKLAVIRQLAAAADRNHVDFIYALSPGLSVCYSSAEDERTLIAKFQSLWDVGVRAFAIGLDDISYTSWNCPEDEHRWGEGGEAAGRAQAYFLNRILQNFIATHPGSHRLQMLPTEYKNLDETPYRAALREELDPSVIIFWTGVTTVTPTITASDAEQARMLFGHEILIGDNYPVNDYVTRRLLLGPYNGREPGVADHVAGVTVNPMVQSEPSKIAQFGAGAFLWNSHAYDPQEAWMAALQFLGGSASEPLKVFAENNYSSAVNALESPALTPLIQGFWGSLDASHRDLPTRSKALSDYFARMAAVPGQLETGMSNRRFVEQSQPWLNMFGLYGEAGQTAVRMLTARQAGDMESAEKEWDTLARLRKQLSEITVIACPLGKCVPTRPAVADGVMEPFLDRAEVVYRSPAPESNGQRSADDAVPPE